MIVLYSCLWSLIFFVLRDIVGFVLVLRGFWVYDEDVVNDIIGGIFCCCKFFCVNKLGYRNYGYGDYVVVVGLRLLGDVGYWFVWWMWFYFRFGGDWVDYFFWFWY